MLRTHTCGELRLAQVGQVVTLAGWVNRRRDHGGLVFVNLRDREGITQVVVDPDAAPDVFRTVHDVGLEWVVAVDGVVRPRPEGQANPNMPTGEIEVLAQSLTVLNPARTTPFEISREIEVDEALRLRYRYLDLRHERLQRNLLLRHRVTAFVRQFLNERGFIEVETPVLIKSTPEGARDFIVPSRLQPGKFYALPQSPQQIKQLLMVAGLDRYYQIARCFRDEDQRADRQLEFTQLDVEMAFIEEEDIMALNEALLIALAQSVTPHLRIREMPFPRLTFAESMARFGNDRPDMRFGVELVDLRAEVAGSGFQVFADTVSSGGQVKAIAVPKLFSRSEIDGLEGFVRERGAAGLIWLSFEAEQVRGSAARFLSEAEVAVIRERTGAVPGTTVLIVAGAAAVVAASLGELRLEVGRRLDLIPADEMAFCWIVDPPLFEWNDGEGRWDSMHHPFTAPQLRDLAKLATDPGSVRARAYDIVCNGNELGGGSIRIHERSVQSVVFGLLGMSEEQATSQFGHLLEAFEYGAPPHGGIAWGFDRVVMVLAGEKSIREVIAFPKTLAGVDPMTNSPSPVPLENLAVLGIALRETPLD
jgi:aspartyl-tRNA synthetase